jgi:hypothetical protein
VERVEGVRWLLCDPGTTATEHPLVFALASTGGEGDTPRQTTLAQRVDKNSKCCGKAGDGLRGDAFYLPRLQAHAHGHAACVRAAPHLRLGAKLSNYSLDK